MFRTSLVVAVSLLAAVSADADDNWPQFRGPGARGISGKALPTAWDSKQNVVWQTDVPGRGWSSPVVWGDRIFVTAVANDKTPEPRKGLYIQDVFGKIPPGDHVRRLYCFDHVTGKPLWAKTVHQGPAAAAIHLKNTYASETPVTDGKHIFAYFGNLGVWCYDMDGNLIWSKAFDPHKIRYGWGTAASPALDAGRLYLVNDNDEASYLLALDAASGKEIWKVARDEKSNWSTPFVWKHKLRTEIVTAGTGRVRSYDTDGKLLWELAGMSSITIPTPFASDDLLYVTSGYVLDALRPLYAIRPDAKGDISLKAGATSNEFIAWSQKQAGPYHPSPLLYEGRIYVLYDKGTLACYDAKTGQEIYGRQRIDVGSDKFTASPWAADGKVYCLSEDGDTFVIRAGPKFEVLGRNALDAMCLATPALVRGDIVLRTANKLYRIGGK